MLSYDTLITYGTFDYFFYCWIIGSIVTVFLATTILVFLTIHHRPDKSGSYISKCFHVAAKL